MKTAVISDIHGNLDALNAVLADIHKVGVDAIVCLGDVIGYGPCPRETTDIVRKVADACVRGNHEVMVTGIIDPRTAPLAEKAALWTRRQLQPRPGPNLEKARERWHWLKSLPRYVRSEALLFAHGTPKDPFTYIDGLPAALEVFDEQMKGARMVLVGHTHVPGFFLLDGQQIGYAPAEPGRKFRYKKSLAIVNVGSVGQPRDRDPRASYVIVADDLSFTFRRVEYDVEAAAERIFKIRELPAALGERLIVGD